MKKCLKTVANSSKFLLFPKYSKQYLYNNQRCLSWGGVSWGVIINMIPQKKINFTGYSLVHINIMINLESMRLIDHH